MPVFGWDDALELAPTSSLTTTLLLAQLRHVVIPRFVPALTMACDEPQAVMRVKLAKNVALASLSVRCSNRERGTEMARQ